MSETKSVVSYLTVNTFRYTYLLGKSSTKLYSGLQSIHQIMWIAKSDLIEWCSVINRTRVIHLHGIYSTLVLNQSAYAHVFINMSFCSSHKQLNNYPRNDLFQNVTSMNQGNVQCISYSDDKLFDRKKSVSLTINSFQHNGETPTIRPAIMAQTSQMAPESIKAFDIIWQHISFTAGSVIHSYFPFTN